MEALLSLIGAKAGTIGVGIGLAAVFGLGVKIGPKLIRSFMRKQMQKLFDGKSPEDKELILAIVKWAEKKIPDEGKGRYRYELVADKLISIFPILSSNRRVMADLIEQAVTAMDEELKKISDGN